jgi:hypothetical protein
MANRTEEEIKFIRELWNNGLDGNELSTKAVAAEAARHFKDSSITPGVVVSIRSRYENFKDRGCPIKAAKATKKPSRPKAIPRGVPTLPPLASISSTNLG